jgi:DNA-binding NtrC family response regulator
MTLPLVLVIDDQFARDATEKALFLNHTGCIETGTGTEEIGASRAVDAPVAEVVFCSGQRVETDWVENDYEVIHTAVRSRGGNGGQWALVLLDVNFDSGERRDDGSPRGQKGDDNFGVTVRERLLHDFPDLPVVMLSGKRQDEIGNTTMSYLSKHKLGTYEARQVLLRFGRVSASASKQLLGLDAATYAETPSSLASFRQAFIHARADASILILGESGTGKEVLAHYIHRMSGRKGAFVAVNVAAIPTSLIESELFGIGRRVATGVDGRPGKFELASGGTLLLDEIGDMPLEMQAKILRVLQERNVPRLGGTEDIPVDIRLICATSRDLAREVAEGRFREDLLYRINTVPITMAPLRARKEDIALLARKFLENFAERQGKTGLSFSSEALGLLTEQPFPGNVRELGNVVERLASGAGHHQIIGRMEVAAVFGESAAGPTLSSLTMTPPAAGSLSIGKGLNLKQVVQLLATCSLDKDDPDLKGALVRLESVMDGLRRRLAGAALERCRNPNDQTLNRQAAMRLLTGDMTLKGKGPARLINEIFGHKADAAITDDDLEQLVHEWSGQTRRDASGREGES